HDGGSWDWYDWGNNIDAKLLQTIWYYSALQSAKNIACITGNSADISWYDSRITSIETNFDTVYWTGSEYRDPSYCGAKDERGNSLAFLIGPPAARLSGKLSCLTQICCSSRNCGPFYEQYPEEALILMGRADYAIDRM